jgi:hypothetical protein
VTRHNEAQSIGGGGGNGGTATSTSNGSTNGTYSASVTLGGGGGASGYGSDVAVTSTGAIATAGYNAYGILAQSIGGGGGTGGDGSVTANTTISLGAGISGNGGASGTGSNVSVATNVGGTITTLGDDAVGIMAQSIGGGGGASTAGCTNSASASTVTEQATACFGNTSVSASTNGPADFVPRADFTLNVGGGSSAAGNGNTVTISVADAIFTTGARSMGIVAQSIGGGGGYAAGAAQNLSGVSVAASAGANNATGGPVSVTVASTGSITTSGAGAWGILAQSIGGGGGFSGDPSLALAIPISNTLSRTGTGNAFANTVSVTVNGNITTTGTNAHGIFAQSIGGSGGILGGNALSTTAELLVGNTAQFTGSSTTPKYWGDGGAINITQGAGSVIMTSGSGSIGIIAQSSGNTAAVNSIAVNISGTVIGGTNAGATEGQGAAGILLTGGGLASNPNTITVNSTGSIGTVDGIPGNAILTNSGYTNVTNAGTITGNINLAGGLGAITNNGTLNTGPNLVASTLTNNGTIAVGGQGGVATTTLTGNLVQSASGTLAVDINSTAAGQKADLLKVTGTASVQGTVAPSASSSSLLPGTLTVLTASNGLTLSAATTQSLVMNWNLAQAGNSATLSPVANFTPQGVALSSGAASVAHYFTNAWNGSDSMFAGAFARLSQVTSASQYTAILNSYAARALGSTAVVNSEGTLLGAPLSCPVFADQGTILDEDNCAWAKFTGSQTSQTSTTNMPGYQIAGTTYRIGGQHEIAPYWYLGGSFAAGQTWATESGGSSVGQVFDGSMAVKHTMGPWLFAGSFALATGSFKNDRSVNIPAVGAFSGVNTLLQSDSKSFLTGGRLRAAYDFAFGNWYIRPYADLDLVYSYVPGFQESGQLGFGYALNVHGGSNTNVIVSPMVEFGGRYNIDATTILRPYAAVGMRATPDNTQTLTASLVGAQPGDGTFQSYTKSPDVLAKVSVGFQLYRVGGLEMRGEYNLEAANAFLSQTGSARVAYHF